MANAFREPPQEILTSLAKWDSQARRLRIAVIVLSAIGVVGGVLVSAGVGDDDATRVFGVVTALAVAGATFMNAGDKSNRMRSGWRVLNAAVLEYRYSAHEDEASLERRLFDAYAEAERTIGDVG